MIVSNEITQWLVSSDHFVLVSVSLGSRPLKFKSADQPLWGKLFDLLVNYLILPHRKFFLQHPIYWNYSTLISFHPQPRHNAKSLLANGFGPLGRGLCWVQPSCSRKNPLPSCPHPKVCDCCRDEQANEKWNWQVKEWILFMEEKDILQPYGAAKSQQNNNKKHNMLLYQ